MSLPRSLLVLPLVLWFAPPVSAQGADDAYFRAIGGYFDVPAEEIAILREWRLPADEIPVVLFVARRASLPVDAVVAIRRRSTPWNDIVRRYGWGAEAFHVALPEGTEGERLEAAYQKYRSTPRSDWRSIALTDAEIVTLVNLRVLSEHLGLPTARVLGARASSNDFAAAFLLLVDRG